MAAATGAAAPWPLASASTPWPFAHTVSPELDPDAPPPSGPLLLAGRRFPLDFAGGEFTVHGAPLRVFETPNSGLGTGLTVWDGSVVLAKFLEARFASLAGERVLELGAGPGLAGLAAAALGADATITDLPYALGGARAGAAASAGALRGRAAVEALDWRAPGASPAAAAARAATLVLAADVVWVEELARPLAQTLGWLTRDRAPPPRVLVAHQSRARASDEAFAAALAAEGLAARALPHALHHPRFESDAIEILEVVAADAGAGGGGPAAGDL